MLDFIIEPLSYETLKEAENLRDNVFNDIEENEKLVLKASLNPEQNQDIYLSNELKNTTYWVALDKETSKVIGLSGLYQEIEDDKDSCWLGWFCIDKKCRGKKYGKALFDFSIKKAQESYKTMHIYSYDIKKYQQAINMYKSYGFELYEVKDTKYKRDIYLKKDI